MKSLGFHLRNIIFSGLATFCVSCASIQQSTLPDSSSKELSSINQKVFFQNVTDQALRDPKVKSLQNIIFDFNDDGLPDILFSDWDKDPIQLSGFLNLGNMNFKRLKINGAQFPKYGLVKLVRGLFGENGVFAVVRYFGNAQSERPMEFYRVSYEASSLNFKQMPSALFPKIAGPIGDFQLLDLNRDGVLDLVIGKHYSYRSNAADYEADSMGFYLGNRTQSDKSEALFTDISQSAGLYSAPRMSVSNKDAPIPIYNLSVCDLNNDNLPDILAAGYGRRWNKLYINTGRSFSNRAQQFGFDGDQNGLSDFRGNGNSFASVCADADNDGLVDVFQCEITHDWAGPTSDLSSILWNRYPNPLLRQTDLPRPPRGSFDNQGDLSASWGDFDLDGLQDLLVSNGDYPPETELLNWRQTSPRKFSDASNLLSETVISPKGAVWVDLDQDGDLDIVSGSSSARGNSKDQVRIFENTLVPSKNGPAWLEVILRSSKATASEQPLGSKVRVFLPNGTVLLRELALSYGTDSEPSEVLHFGLGMLNPTITKLNAEITWSNGTVSKTTLRINHLNRINY